MHFYSGNEGMSLKVIKQDIKERPIRYLLMYSTCLLFGWLLWQMIKDIAKTITTPLPTYKVACYSQDKIIIEGISKGVSERFLDKNGNDVVVVNSNCVYEKLK
jgi:hypothetical protein